MSGWRDAASFIDLRSSFSLAAGGEPLAVVPGSDSRGSRVRAEGLAGEVDTDSRSAPRDGVFFCFFSRQASGSTATCTDDPDWLGVTGGREAGAGCCQARGLQGKLNGVFFMKQKEL